MPIFPGLVLPAPIPQFFDNAGNPLSGGKLHSYIAGTVTPQALYTDALLTIPYSNPITLDAYGRPSGPIYMLATGYKIDLKTSAGVSIAPYPADNIADPGQIFQETLGNVLAGGSFNKTSGYTVLVTDYLVTMASTGGPNPCLVNLPPSVNAKKPVVIKNVGTIALSVVPNGANTIEGLAAAFTVPVAASPTFPAIELVPDGVSGWWIRASHKT